MLIKTLNDLFTLHFAKRLINYYPSFYFRITSSLVLYQLLFLSYIKKVILTKNMQRYGFELFKNYANKKAYFLSKQPYLTCFYYILIIFKLPAITIFYVYQKKSECNLALPCCFVLNNFYKLPFFKSQNLNYQCISFI